MQRILSVLLWASIAALGGLAYTLIAITRQEPLNAVWILIAAACTYSIAYRFYSKWIAASVLTLNDRRATPAHVHEDGKDFVKTHKWIVFGHHFAAISGPGPLVGPVLAAQFGYLPGLLWILIGVVLGGAVQDFFILFASMRRSGKSLGEMVREEVGTVAGIVALVAILGIMVILIAVLGLVVVKALAGSPWGAFTIAATLPIAFFMGAYLRFLRPGKVMEVSVIGVTLLLLAVWGGQWVYHSPTLSAFFDFKPITLAWCIIGYGLLASALPVWMLLAPRDYLSTFMKLGTIGLLAIGILTTLPDLALPPLTRFIDGTGPIFSGKVFPFCFITIACGAISGFHSLISSGTTPKIIARERHARQVGYGSMLLESSVAVMALIAACTLQPGVYFAMNAPAAVVGATPEAAVATITSWGFPVTVETMAHLAQATGESTLFGRAGGAPTLALGMANIFSQVFGGAAMMGLWYHFAIMFEALFILTTVDAGTRVGRFLLQAVLGLFSRKLADTRSTSANVFASAVLVSAWGYFLVQGVLDPLGGINSLWPLFGIANQLLALVALCLCTTLLIKMGKARHLWVTGVPLLWLGTVTFTAAIQKIFHSSPKIGFLSLADKLKSDLAAGLIPAEKILATERTIFNLNLNAVVCGAFLSLVIIILMTSLWRWYGMLRESSPRDLRESSPVWLSDEEMREAPAAPGFLGRMAAHGILLMALVRSMVGGQVEPAHAESQTEVATKIATTGDTGTLGHAWAKAQEERFKKPKCC